MRTLFKEHYFFYFATRIAPRYECYDKSLNLTFYCFISTPLGYLTYKKRISLGFDIEIALINGNPSKTKKNRIA